MAIRFGMTIAEMIAQLTRGFRSVTGRNPDGLEKIKIQQEAVQRFKDMNKVVDMQGRTLDPSKTIMGGTQEGAALRSGIMKATGTKPKPVTSLDDPIKRVYEREKKAGKFKNIRLRDGRKIESEEDFREYIDELNEDSNFADGGRIGYKDGPDQPGRRKFMKIIGGLAALPIVGKFFKAGKVAAPAVEAARETVSQAPSYFFDLAEKIKILGRESKVFSRERVREIDYKNYTLQEDVATGDMTIIKRKGDPEFAYEEEVMTLRKGQADEMTKGKTPPDEYEELTVRPDPDGKMKDVEDGIEPESIQEIVDEISEGGGNLDQQTLEEIARGKLAGGGIATMLGE
jgi:hypothetical protein